MLVGNINRLSSNPMRILCGQGALNDVLVPNIGVGAKQNQSFAFGDYAATPYGYYPPYAWIRPKKKGALSSHSFTFLSISAAGIIEVVPAVIIGTTTIDISPSGGIFAYVAGDGTATIDISADLEKEAIGWIVGPLAIDISADMESYARGFMDGSTEDLSTLTPTNVGAFVWAALQNEINNPGSAGAALLAAQSAGDPWLGLLENYEDDATFGAFIKTLLTTNGFFGLR